MTGQSSASVAEVISPATGLKGQSYPLGLAETVLVELRAFTGGSTVE